MAFALQFCPPDHIHTHIENGSRYFHFEDNDKSITSVFWHLVHTIEKKGNICLVLENQKDAEHLNYLISRHGLGDLSIILSSTTPEINSHTLGKIKDALAQAYPAILEEDIIRLNNYNRTLTSSQNSLAILRSDQINGKSAIELIDKLRHAGGMAKDEGVKPLQISASISNYKNQKNIVHQAEHLYQNSFSFLELDFPFANQVIEDYSHAQLTEILHEQKSQLERIIHDFNQIESELFNEIKTSYTHTNQRSKQEINIIDLLLARVENQDLETIRQKLNHHFKKLVQLSGSALSGNITFNTDRYQALKDLIIQDNDFHRERINALYEEELENIKHHDKFGQLILDLFLKSDLWINALKQSGFFKNFQFGKAATFTFQKKLLLDIHQHIRAALHFLDNNAQFYSWKIFLSSISDEDQAIINYLSQKSNNWRLDYNRLFVQQMVDRMICQLDAPCQQLMYLQENLDDYQALYLQKLKSEIIKDSGFEGLEDLDWDNLISQHSTDLTRRFPIMIIGLNVYASNKEAIRGAYSDFVFLNTPSDNIEDFGKENNVFFISDEDDIKSLRKRIKVPARDITYIEGPSAIINRPLSELNRSELNRCSMFMASELNNLEANHRIFQLKNLSIISFWSDTKNSKLLTSLNDKGIKEIFSSLDDNKLMPAIFSNLDHQIFVLIEDGLIINGEKDNILRQINLLSQLKRAGIKIINIDNLDPQIDIDKEIQKIEFTIQSSDLVVESN